MRILLKHRLLVVGTGLAVLTNAGLWLYLSNRLVASDQQLPLHYNIYYGIDLVGPWWYLYALPLGALGVLLVNGILSVILEKREVAISFLLTGASVLLQAGAFFLASLILNNV